MRTLLPVAAAAVLLGGCGLLTRPGLIFGGQGEMTVRIVDDLNHHTPVAVDMVTVYDKGLEKELVALSAAEWFAGRKKFRQVTPEQGFDLRSWEWVPGQVVGPQPFKYRVGALSTILYAGYATPGEHRARIKPNRSFRLVLGTEGFAVELD